MSKPASCITYAFLEGFCSGVPVVSFGNGTGNWNGRQTFMIDKYIENGVNGFYSDDNNELQSYLKDLLNDKELARKIGEKGRETGLKLFHRDIIKKQWDEFLKSL
jgi:glycosyltransferase involved in cell wall biosynthesis